MKNEAHGLNTTPVALLISSTGPLIRRLLRFCPVVEPDPSSRALSSAQLPNSGHKPPPYAAASRSSVSRVAYTGGLGAAGPLVGFNEVGARPTGKEDNGGCGWVDIRGGTDPVSRIRDSTWSR